MQCSRKSTHSEHVVRVIHPYRHEIMNELNPPEPQFTGSEPSSTGQGDTKSAVASKLTEAKHTIQDSARRAKDTVKTSVTEAGTRLKQQAGETAEQKKREAADRLHGYSSAIHESAQAFENEDPNIAHFTHQAADKLQGVADYVRDSDFRSLKTDAENLARRHPVAFFGGLFIGGLVIGNLLKASGQRNSSGTSSPDEFAFDEGHSDYDPADYAVPPESGSSASHI